MSGKFEFVEVDAPLTRIKVVGVGGGGCNAVDSMIDMGLTGVDFVNINTDLQALSLSKCPNKLHIGDNNTAGMGCGGDPAWGEKAAVACKEQITEVLGDCEMVFIAAGLGGGTGTGASPVVAEIAKSLGLLTVAIVTRPFSFEGPQRAARAEQGLQRMSEFVDTKIVILNDKLLDAVGAKTPLREAFDLVNRVLAQGVHAISDLISVPGEINVDFMDVRSIMGETGGAVMGVGIGKGENRGTEAVKKACASPLQEKIVIEGAQGVLISIAGSPDVTLQEINMATTTVYEAADPEANIIFGLVIDPELKDEMRVTIIATGFPEDRKPKPKAQPRQEPLASPRTDLDLDTKLKSMLGEESKPREPEATQTPSQPAPQAAAPSNGQSARPAPTTRPVPRPAPAERSESASPEAAPAREPSIFENTDPEIRVENPATRNPEPDHAPVSAGQGSSEEKEDLSQPAYVRRRRTLFE